MGRATGVVPCQTSPDSLPMSILCACHFICSPFLPPLSNHFFIPSIHPPLYSFSFHHSFLIHLFIHFLSCHLPFVASIPLTFIYSPTFIHFFTLHCSSICYHPVIHHQFSLIHLFIHPSPLSPSSVHSQSSSHYSSIYSSSHHSFSIIHPSYTHLFILQSFLIYLSLSIHSPSNLNHVALLKEQNCAHQTGIFPSLQ